MWKPILAGTVALALVGGSLAFAQNRAGRDGASQWRPSVEDMRAFGEARLAGLKAGLVLNPDQEKNWPAFEQAARDFTRLRIERRTAATDSAATPRPTDPAEWMQRRAAAMTETGGVLKKLGDATSPLYNSLDDAQKRRFAILSRLGSGGQAFRDRGRQWQRGGMRRTDNEGQDQMAPERRLMSPVRGEERL
jgi:zinc resistance-associated protein